MVEYLERTTGVQFPSADTIMQGYLHFEALTEHDYEYSCVNCGDHPPVVIMDLHKKGAFHLSGKHAFIEKCYLLVLSFTQIHPEFHTAFNFYTHLTSV